MCWSLDMSSCFENHHWCHVFSLSAHCSLKLLRWELRLCSEVKQTRAHGICGCVFTCYPEVWGQQQTPGQQTCNQCELSLGALECAHCRLQWTVRLKTGITDVFLKNLEYRGYKTLGLLQTSSMEASYFFIMCFFNIWISVTIQYICLGDYCNTFCLWNSGSLWTKELHPTFTRHEGKEIMMEFLFLGELSL